LGNKKGSSRLKDATENKIKELFLEGGITATEAGR